MHSPKIYQDPLEIEQILIESISLDDHEIRIRNEARLRSEGIDTLIWNAVFGEAEVQAYAQWLIWETAQAIGIQPSSIHDFYMARGHGAYGNLTVPAINIRGLAYDTARAMFRAAVKHDVVALICEISRGEIGYTSQRPGEYTSVVLSAAIREGFRGPVFIQGDHFQINQKKYATDPDGEMQALKELIREAIPAGFFNIDIDTSTLVDLSQPTIDEQQRMNYQLCADLSAFIRSMEPDGITISLGGEIGEVGQKNSTEEELRAFMDGYHRALAAHDPMVPGISKISVQTGTSHGGVVLADGTLAQVKIDFDVLRRLSDVAREVYHIAGAVQHGASTLPESAFHKFVEAGACEVHLATGFQNIIFEHPSLPEDFRQKVYDHLRITAADERKATDTDEQFFYKTRKKGFGGVLKKDWWTLPPDVLQAIGENLEERFAFLFKELGVINTTELVHRLVRPQEIHKSRPAGPVEAVTAEDVKGLAD
ncbi:MAG: class II fructose-bisphosphate aldolase [Chloroflexi bacterium]|nr:class II fructose-bisphosphate aldolase [Chloroflexota bacterium]